jgi:hypothetical protein
MLQATFEAGDTIIVDATPDGLVIDRKAAKVPAKAR